MVYIAIPIQITWLLMMSYTDAYITAEDVIKSLVNECDWLILADSYIAI